jgi:hypothetical protein
LGSVEHSTNALFEAAGGHGLFFAHHASSR